MRASISTLRSGHHAHLARRVSACVLLWIGAATPARAAEAPGVPATVTGELVVVVADDFDNKRSERLIFVEDRKNDRRYAIDAGSAARDVGRGGRTVTVSGRLQGDRLVLDPVQSQLLAAGADGGSSEIVAASADAVTGDQNTLVIVADFQDVAVDCPVDSVRNTMFSDPQGKTVDALYRESSQGAVGFKGTVVGPYRIPFQSTGACDTAGWADAAEQAAAASVDTTQYPRKVFVLPRQNTCGASGFGSVGGAQTRAWVMRCELPGLYAHELGHNLGMNHATTPTSDYGDGSDPLGMEVLGLRQHNAPHQEQMGWRPASQFRSVTTSGTYDVAPLELTPAQTSIAQALVIPKPDTGDYYYVSYRAPMGFDSSLSSGLLSRLHVHRYARNGGRTTYVTGLLVGETFTDGANSITISHLGRTTSYSTVDVRIGSAAPQCARSAPTLTVSPTSQSAAAGSALGYVLSVTNRDSAACTASTFAVTGSAPSGWSAAASPQTLSLAPGASASSTITVTSAGSASAATYSVTLNAVDASVAGHSASASVSYTVTASCVRRAPILTVLPDLQSGSPGQSLRYTVSVSNQDDAACASSTFNLSRAVPSGWSGVLSAASMTLGPGATGQASLDVTSATGATSGSYTVTANASDSIGRSAADTGTYSVSGPLQDTSAPTAPASLTASYSSKQLRVSLSWGASTDNVGVTGYRVWRDGALLGETTGTWYVDGSITTGPTYTYYVTARDAAGNQSPASNSATVQTAKSGAKPRTR